MMPCISGVTRRRDHHQICLLYMCCSCLIQTRVCSSPLAATCSSPTLKQGCCNWHLWCPSCDRNTHTAAACGSVRQRTAACGSVRQRSTAYGSVTREHHVCMPAVHHILLPSTASLLTLERLRQQRAAGTTHACPLAVHAVMPAVVGDPCQVTDLTGGKGKAEIQSRY